MTVFFKMGIAASLTFTAFAAEKPLAAMRLPLTAKIVATPKVKIVFAGEPTTAVRAWADEAAHVVIEWWPQVAHLLSTDDFHSPEQLTLTFKKELKGPAHRTTDGLFIGIPWITAHPDDFGMIIHEMTHAIQDDHGAPRDEGWLVEGIADNIRYWHHEPEVPHSRIDSTKASYRDGYSTTGAFLAWIMVKYDRRTVRASTPHFARENTPTRFLRRSTARRWMHFGPSSLRADIHTNMSKKLNLEARKPRRDRANISAFLASWLPNPAAMMRSTTQHPIFPPHS
ncbi:MAG: basic secretory protein-like protein [Verrucomicrobiota bacterium]